MLTPNVTCIEVCLKRSLRTTLGIVSRLSSITIRIPWRPDSSGTSVISESFSSWTRSAIFSSTPPSPPLRQLGDDDRLLALPDRLDMSLRLHLNAAAAGAVSLADALVSEDRRGRGEVGAGL